MARMAPEAVVVSVFADGPDGGNPAPIVLAADRMSDAEMQGVARRYGLESSFVVAVPDGSDADLALRFWVPNHEMSMCGHATLGAVWLLHRLGRLPAGPVTVWTASGIVPAWVSPDGSVEIGQPPGRLDELPPEVVQGVLDVLGLGPADLADRPVSNATTSRTKTLVPLADPDRLATLRPDFARMEQICTAAGSTGLYPYAVLDAERAVVDARQFPRSSGYPEDAATGIAAAALAFALLDAGLVATDGPPLTVRQGRAMGRPSRITVRFDTDSAGTVSGCRLGGAVREAVPG
jgi:PhzF family phenazine biosynthesis protein